MNVLLISTYELGRQPFGLASPAAWLEAEGCSVSCVDLSVEKLAEAQASEADLVAIYLPMHTATRLACAVAGKISQVNPRAHLCFYGLYAPVNEAYLRQLGGRTILGGEFEAGLVSLVRRLKAGAESSNGGQPEPLISLERQEFLVPNREGLPALDKYAKLRLSDGEHRTVGYTEASRGCKHVCRHCPIVPVYEGRFRIVQREIVIEDIRRQVARGAGHITFGDPDFLNGPAHAVAIVEALHREFPELTYDATIKVEHLLKQRKHLATLRDTGCLFVTTAVESIDDRTLDRFAKGHTRDDFIESVRLCREVGLRMNPTFVTFTPWITVAGYVELLDLLLELDLVDYIAPIQYAIRLLIPGSSKLLELEEVRAMVGEFDGEKLYYPWTHPDPAVDRLHQEVLRAVEEGQSNDESRREIFRRVWALAHAAAEGVAVESTRIAILDQAPPRATVPYLTEPWYC